MEKYEFSEQDAKDMADFLVPILDFDPEKRPTAAQCLLHPWVNSGPRLLQPSVSVNESEGGGEKSKRERDDREAVEVGVGNIALTANKSTKMEDLSSGSKLKHVEAAAVTGSRSGSPSLNL